jgi:DNA-binding NarL/FixJ family response regulator
MQLSQRQARVVELLLRGMSEKQIAADLGIKKTTVREYLDRISVRTRTRGRMELAMHVLAVSHEVIRKNKSPQLSGHRSDDGKQRTRK